MYNQAELVDAPPDSLTPIPLVLYIVYKFCMYKHFTYVNVLLGPISIVSNAIGCGPCFVVATCHRLASSTWPHKLRYTTHTHTLGERRTKTQGIV